MAASEGHCPVHFARNLDCSEMSRMHQPPPSKGTLKATYPIRLDSAYPSLAPGPWGILQATQPISYKLYSTSRAIPHSFISRPYSPPQDRIFSYTGLSSGFSVLRNWVLMWTGWKDEPFIDLCGLGTGLESSLIGFVGGSHRYLTFGRILRCLRNSLTGEFSGSEWVAPSTCQPGGPTWKVDLSCGVTGFTWKRVVLCTGWWSGENHHILLLPSATSLVRNTAVIGRVSAHLGAGFRPGPSRISWHCRQSHPRGHYPSFRGR